MGRGKIEPGAMLGGEAPHMLLAPRRPSPRRARDRPSRRHSAPPATRRPTRQRGPAADLRARRSAARRMVAAEPHDLGRAAADVEQDDAFGLPGPSAACSRSRQASASVSRSTISRSRPTSRCTRARNSTPFSAERQASVAISRARVTPRLRILSRQIDSASIARSIAASPSRPEAAMPSPRRMMRENASITRKPSRIGRATSRRQLLVPRSSAA